MGTQHAQLAALGIGEHDPALVGALPDVDRPGAERDDAFDLGDLVVRVQVDVQPVLDLLLLGVEQEAQAEPGKACG
jgi:hypothetical protein